MNGLGSHLKSLFRLIDCIYIRKFHDELRLDDMGIEEYIVIEILNAILKCTEILKQKSFYKNLINPCQDSLQMDKREWDL